MFWKNVESDSGGAPMCFHANAPGRTPRSGYVPPGKTSNTSNTSSALNHFNLAHLGAAHFARSKVRDEEGVELSGLLPLESLAEHKLSIRVEAMSSSPRHWKVFI